MLNKKLHLFYPFLLCYPFSTVVTTLRTWLGSRLKEYKVKQVHHLPSFKMDIIMKFVIDSYTTS